jgi:hypothetical protein
MLHGSRNPPERTTQLLIPVDKLNRDTADWLTVVAGVFEHLRRLTRLRSSTSARGLRPCNAGYGRQRGSARG